MNPRLIRYARGSDEYVVILTEDDATPDDFIKPGYKITDIVEFDVKSGSLTSFPCDRELAEV